MKTTIELQGYEITIEENEGMVVVSATKDGEVIEEFELGEGDMTQDEDEEGQMLPFGEEEDEDFDEEEDEDFDEEEDEDFDEEEDEDEDFEEEEDEEEDDFVQTPKSQAKAQASQAQKPQAQAQKPQAQMESFSAFLKRRKY